MHVIEGLFVYSSILALEIKKKKKDASEFQVEKEICLPIYVCMFYEKRKWGIPLVLSLCGKCWFTNQVTE